MADGSGQDLALLLPPTGLWTNGHNIFPRASTSHRVSEPDTPHQRRLCLHKSKIARPAKRTGLGFANDQASRTPPVKRVLRWERFVTPGVPCRSVRRSRASLSRWPLDCSLPLSPFCLVGLLCALNLNGEEARRILRKESEFSMAGARRLFEPPVTFIRSLPGRHFVPV